jgi:hypothetical protein
MRIVLTTTWNSDDLVATFLSHYQRLGFDRIVVMDFDSTDGTRDVLHDPRWHDFVSLVPFPGLSRLDSSNLMLDHAKAEFPPHTLGLFCDPDELLVLPAMDARKDVPSDLGGEGISGWKVPRSNMTCKRSLAVACQDEMHALSALLYRAGGTRRKNPADLIGERRLEPAWIFTQLPPKILVRLSDTTAIKAGDHTAAVRDTELVAAPEGAYILHYPFRSLQAFQKKIVMAQQDFAANPNRPPNSAWQIQRWIRLSEERLLHNEYFEQFPDDEDFGRRLAEGSLQEDTKIANFHGHHANLG